MRNIKGQFVKGHKHSEESKQKIRENHAHWNKGKKFPSMTGENNPAKRPEVREKISKAVKGAKKNYIVWNKGKTWSKEIREKLSKSLKGRKVWNKGLKGYMAGEKNCNWKGGITPINTKIRNSLEMKQWREAVFARDDYRCQDCGERGGELHADHIYPFALFPLLRLVLANGRTLCIDCHRKTDTWGGRVRVASSTGLMDR